MMKSPPVTIYSAVPAVSNPARYFSEAWHDLRACRGVAWRLFLRNLRAQYRRSFLGYAWLLLPPIATTLTWVFLSRSRIVAVGATTLPFPLYVLAGTMLWQAFVEAINCPLTQLRGAREVVTKVRVPHEAFVFAGLGAILFSLAVRLAVFAVAMLFWHWPVPWSALAAPIPIAALLILAGAIGLLLAPMGLLYQDVQRSVEVVCGFAFFVTPIVYPAPQTWPASLLNSLNPIAPLLETARNWLALGLVTAPGFFAVSGASLALLAVSWILYRLAVPHIVSRL
jgi:lipopolysaccharide transport system permease protein